MNATVSPTTAEVAAFRLAVQNVVAIARVADSLPLADLAAMIPGAAHAKRQFPGIVLRMTGPKVACHIYESGKIVLTGLGAVDRLPAALAALVTVLRAAGAELIEPVPEPEVINLVASGNLGERIALLRLALALDLERVEYEPEQFAGLVYRAEAGGVALVFASGAIVIMGVRSVEQARAVAAEVCGVIDAEGAWQSPV